jgi:hypothetical protein
MPRELVLSRPAINHVGNFPGNKKPYQPESRLAQVFMLFTGHEKKKARLREPIHVLVPRRGLEPPHLAAHGPEPCASTNSAIWALRFALKIYRRRAI